MNGVGLGLSYSASGVVGWYATLEISLVVSIKLNIPVICNSTTAAPSIYTRYTLHLHGYRMFMAAFSTTVKTGDNPNVYQEENGHTNCSIFTCGLILRILKNYW